jgi:hypothetical protein
VLRGKGIDNSLGHFRGSRSVRWKIKIEEQDFHAIELWNSALMIW